MIELPYEIQRIIFEITATLHRSSPYRLILVARHVRDWILPILYENILVRDRKAAECLLNSIQACDSLPPTKSLTVGSHIPAMFIIPLCGKLSKAVVSFTLFRNFEDTDHLRLLSFPSIRRLTLVFHDVQIHRLDCIPHHIASSVSHLALITNTVQGTFALQRSANIASAIQRNDIIWLNSFVKPRPSSPPFHRLTFFAISYKGWPGASIILTLAHHLQCFALLLPSHSSMHATSQCILQARMRRDPRIVVLTRHGHAADWSIDDRFGPSDFWTTLEDVSRNRYICDDGERWEADIINDFRARHPEISLSGD